MPRLTELSGSGSTKKISVGTHTELPAAIDLLRKHLEQYPEDGSLFLTDPIKAYALLGVTFSPEIEEHILHALKDYKLVTPDRQNLFDRMVTGERSPFVLEVQLTPPGSRLRSIRTFSDIENHVLSEIAGEQGRAALQESLARWKSGKTLSGAPIPISEAQGYDVAIQLSQEAINDIIEEVYNHGSLSKPWEGSELIEWSDFGICLRISYSIKLELPALDLGVPLVDSVTLGVDAHAVFKLEIDIDDLPVEGDQSFEFDDELHVDLGVTLQTGIIIGEGSKPGLVAAYIDLVNVASIRIAINGESIPEGLLKAITVLLDTVCKAHFALQKTIPLTMDLEEAARAGVPIYPPETKILQSVGSNAAALCILIDVKGTTPGNKEAIRHFIPPGEDFAMLISSELIYKGWNAAKSSKFPIYEGDLKIDNPDFRLLDERMYAKVEAHYELFDNCLGSWTVDATARIWTRLESFQKDSIWYGRPKEVDVDIDMDDWDRFVFETILGALLALLGVGGPVARSIISKIIFELIMGLAEKYAAEAVGGYSVGVYGRLPGTNRVAISSTPVLPSIKPSGITTFGNLEFRAAN